MFFKTQTNGGFPIWSEINLKYMQNTSTFLLDNLFQRESLARLFLSLLCKKIKPVTENRENILGNTYNCTFARSERSKQDKIEKKTEPQICSRK